jgi:beta-lactamase class A
MKFAELVPLKWGKLIMIIGLTIVVHTSCKQDKLLNSLNTEKVVNKTSDTNSLKTAKEKIDSKNLNNKSYQTKQDTTTISNILRESSFLEQMTAWRGKVLFVKFDPSQPKYKFRSYYHNAFYQDSNNNNIQDQSDQGFFNPGSTVKVGIAALALEKLNQSSLNRESEYRLVRTSIWYRIDEDIRRALIISDNDATNRLILWLGFDRINQNFKDKGLEHFAVNRLMLNQGTLVASPSFEIRFNNKVINQLSQPVSVQSTCHEVASQTGNCATASDLVGILTRVVQPEYFTVKENFYLRQSDRTWLQKVMTHTPRQEGFEYADDYCRFLIGLEQKVANKSGKMLSKCGVALFSNTYVDSSFIETDSGDKYYIVFSVTPPKATSEKEIFQWMNKVAIFILPRLP